MKSYLLSLLLTAVAVTVVDLFAPERTARHVNLLASLLLLCVLASPLTGVLKNAAGFFADPSFPSETEYKEEDWTAKLEDAKTHASKEYFATTLASAIAKKQGFSEDDVRCRVEWKNDDSGIIPIRVTVVLSGQAIWKDPAPIEAFVEKTVGCECVTAIG